MASPTGSGTSSGSCLLPNSGSDEDLRAAVDQRKRKRMLSNRESARRSRLRKQKHLDELMAQVAQLRTESSEMVTALNITSQHYVGVEAENSVLRTQMMELSARLQSLCEILLYMNGGGGGGGGGGGEVRIPFGASQPMNDDLLMRPWNMMLMNQPIMTSVDMFHYC